MTNQTVIESSCHQKSKAPLQMRVQGATRKVHVFFRVDDKMQWLLAYFDNPCQKQIIINMYHLIFSQLTRTIL